MPWKASSAVDERMRFVLEQERGLHTMTELCEAYGRPVTTGCGGTSREGWRRRRIGTGLRVNTPTKTPEVVEEAVLELRRAYISWGSPKAETGVRAEGSAAAAAGGTRAWKECREHEMLENLLDTIEDFAHMRILESLVESSSKIRG